MKAIIIDDEPHCCQVVARILENNCPDIAVVAVCGDGKAGLKAIGQHQPDLVFLDVEMPRMNGLEMLDALGTRDLNFTLIFTTAYDRFAVQAFKFSAFDYLLKPIDDAELVATIQKLQRTSTPAAQLEYFKHTLTGGGLPDKLSIATSRGITFVEIPDIVALEADSNYTKIHLKNTETVWASKTLGYFEDLFKDRPLFFRTHKQFVINLNCVKEYIGGEHNLVVLQNGLQAKIARSRREAFFSLFRV